MTPGNQGGEFSIIHQKTMPLTGKGRSFNPNASVKFISSDQSNRNGSFLMSETEMNRADGETELNREEAEEGESDGTSIQRGD